MNSTSTIRGLVSAAIDALPGWRPSKWAPDLFGQDPDNEAHHTFCVSVPDTQMNNTERRQRPTEGLLVESTIEVQWLHRLAGDSQSTSYDAMLDAEQSLVGAVRAITSAHILVVGMSRRSMAEGWIMGTVRLNAVYVYALQ